jgi:exopolyphosphatase
MAAVLQSADLAPSQLLTLSDIPDDLPAEHTRWLLVDHNSLTGPLARRFASGGTIIGCIDHHEDERVVPSDVVPRIVEPCGSCMSLIVEESRALWDKVAREQGREEEQRLAALALAPVLIDTINLTEEHKVRPKDVSAAEFLETRLQGGDGVFERTAFFDRISAVKEDISPLGFRDIIRKDYKEWTEGKLKLGVTSVVKGLDYLAGKGSSPTEFLDAVEEWGKERDLDVVSVMTAENGDAFRRNLLVWGRTAGGVEALRAFEAASSEKLQLKTYGDGKFDEDSRKAWHQENLAASRKQVAPLLRDALNTVS